MGNAIDQEIEAIHTLLSVLEPLSARARQSALEYVLRRLEIELKSGRDRLKDEKNKEDRDIIDEDNDQQGDSNKNITHIKELKEQKKPRSASEMAAIVAYYVSHIATGEEKKDSITTDDIETWFKIAEFKLPGKLEFTLSNAKKAGYLKQAGVGQYALNPVGYNLVMHSLPKSGAKGAPSRKKAVKKKKVTQKKTTSPRTTKKDQKKKKTRATSRRKK